MKKQYFTVGRDAEAATTANKGYEVTERTQAIINMKLQLDAIYSKLLIHAESLNGQKYADACADRAIKAVEVIEREIEELITTSIRQSLQERENTEGRTVKI